MQESWSCHQLSPYRRPSRRRPPARERPLMQRRERERACVHEPQDACVHEPQDLRSEMIAAVDLTARSGNKMTAEQPQLRLSGQLKIAEMPIRTAAAPIA